MSEATGLFAGPNRGVDARGYESNDELLARHPERLAALERVLALYTRQESGGDPIRHGEVNDRRTLWNNRRDPRPVLRDHAALRRGTRGPRPTVCVGTS